MPCPVASNSDCCPPRCGQVEFAARFPFATVKLADEHLPLQVEPAGWSPVTPDDADNSSLPVAALECRFTNRTAQPVAAVFSYNSANFLAGRRPTGASLFVRFHLAPGASRTIALRLCRHVPKRNLRFGRNPATAAGKTPAALAEYYRLPVGRRDRRLVRAGVRCWAGAGSGESHEPPARRAPPPATARSAYARETHFSRFAPALSRSPASIMVQSLE